MMNMKIAKQTSVLENLVLNEPVDMEVLELLLNSTLLRKETKKNGEFREDERELLNKYKNIIKREGDNQFAKVKYVREKWCGRVGAERGVGLVNMRSVVRHTLAKAVGFKDIDLKNCHPELLVQLCKKNGYEISILKGYVDDRDAFLKKMIDDIQGVNRDMAKQLVIRLIYLGTLQNWAFDNGINLHDIPEWLIEWSDSLLKELEIVAKLIIDINPKLVKEVSKGSHSSTWNRDASVMSFFLQEWEERVLEIIYVYCVNNSHINNNIAVLCYDGIMLKETDAPDCIFEKLSSEIKKQTGFQLELVYKEFDKALSIEELKKNQIDDGMLDKEMLGRFNTEYFASLDDYIFKKLYFEKFVCKVLRPDPMFVYIESDAEDGGDGLVFYSQNKIKETFNHLNSGQFDTFGKPIKFMDLWVKDETIRCYNKMDFIPYNDRSPIETHIFNLFRGFNALIHTEYDTLKTDKILQPFFDLGLQLCGGDKDHFNFLNMYLADIFQNPQIKNPLAFIIKGKQGTGKNVWLNAVGKTLGSHHYITSSNPKDFFGDYAEGFYHKLLVNMNECEGKDTFDFEGKIKSFITEDTITLNRKFVQPITIKNLARLIIFTNKPNPIPIDVKSKDRRYVVFETTSHYLQDKYGKSFWSGLVAHFNKAIFKSALYDFYNNMDISKFDVRKRPITKAYTEMCRLYVPVEVLFLANKIEMAKASYEQDTGDFAISELKRWDSIGVKGAELYEEYISYCKTYGFYKDSSTFQKNIKSFYHKLGELDLPIISTKTDNTYNFKFDGNMVLDEMKRRKWIDYNADDMIEELAEDTNGDDFTDYFDV